ncbi:oligopeptidase B [Pseudoduganella lurida]|uniref:Oligopeptidase B n=1 Tax=Pseudoduganella lurida TaxID=1036180 RepID=A0A562RER4_9BURK|nr:prolyl oligopeptidase family serine peptidase [Pseudoduganella lurida]TWI67403.1 oligopeptidase B [Pseudoduganella lurida]
MTDRRKFLLSATGLAASTLLPAIPAFAAVSRSRWPVPPQHARVPKDVGALGYHRMDDYAWFQPQDWHAVLRAPDALDAPVKAVVKLENDYTNAMLAPTGPLQNVLSARMATLEGIAGAPVEVRAGDWLYYEHTRAGSDHPVYARKPAGGGAEQVLLDVGKEAQGKKFYKLHWNGPQRSQDGRLVGWTADQAGSGIFSIYVRDIASGKLLVDDIDDTHGEITFSPDGRYLYWVGRSDKGRPDSVHRREVGKPGSTLIYEEKDPAFFIGLRTTAAGGYVVIRISNGDMAEVRLVPMSEPTAAPVLVEARTDKLHYDVEEWNGKLLILTNADGATDYQLKTATPQAIGRAAWQPFVAHQPGRFIAAIHPFAGYLVREEWRDALPRLVVMSPDGKEREIGFDEAAYALSVPPGQGWQSPTLAFSYQSPRSPNAPCVLTLATAQYARVGKPAASKAFDRERYEVRRLVAKAEDGALVPITVLMRKGQKLDGSAPLFQYGYGSYGATSEAEFSPFAIALVDQGWIHTIAHVRGGAERGTDWWRSVLKQGKKKTFTDFIACAEHLVAQRYTRKGRIVAHGYSAGGLLMGAIYTMRPDLWAGVIAQVPFVDVLSTIEHFDIHPLGTTSFPFWGDPRVPEDHAYMATYSPYDNLRKAAYPALLAQGSVADDRVAFWEPLKFAAKARTLTTAGNPILSKTLLYAGHMGDPGATAVRAQHATYGAFAIWAADRKWGDVPQRPA